MTRIITPGLFLVAVMLTSACTDDAVDAPPSSGPAPDSAACCRPTAPRPTIDSFDLGQRARERLDWLNRAAPAGAADRSGWAPPPPQPRGS